MIYNINNRVKIRERLLGRERGSKRKTMPAVDGTFL